MQYRNFGKINFSPSALGFGAMRLPTSDGAPSSPIVVDEAVKMIRHAIDSGVNYVDTAYVYHDGKSETLVGKALKDGYREKARLATKSPVWMMRAPSDFDKYLDEQLARLQTDYIDFYLLHSLSVNTWQYCVLRHNLIERAEAAKKAGKIKHIGFSFHDSYPVFEEIINHYDWDFCQIQLNYLNEEYQAGLKGLELAASKNIAAVIMEPLLGGKLANPPKAVSKIFEKEGISPVQTALDYLWELPGVSTVLSGMSTFSQVEDNLRYAGSINPAGMSETQKAVIKKVQEYFKNTSTVPCTSCQYCMPCPSGVNIPANLNAYNELSLYDDPSVAVESRRNIVQFHGTAGLSESCVGCAVCEEKCPQHIKISELMPAVSEAFKNY